jgi:hypothetical protein
MSVAIGIDIFIVVVFIIGILCMIACCNEIINFQYTEDDGLRYSEDPSRDIVIDLSGVYIQSERIRDTINPLFNDSFIDLSQNSDSVV